ncbi:tyrosine-type recombinase/integrase [Pseudarthrobacter sp. MDT3-26]|uniref:tyrosine-type recombinase/integrase n=1 Tax=Pseudarthrobacter raffinosi TaxID=2953651 RepID=UPI00208F7906|nr:tyrosine-type recombinase/integrase [Pseudarthrobacter sp. MDT3-26]MCO4263756.1 tyrosine-type recombinase/integrase [Pseudarthrobacter sp. MDT3-26]
MRSFTIIEAQQQLARFVEQASRTHERFEITRKGVTPHTFRRAVATAINEQAGVDLAAELLGHTDPKITLQHYIRVNPTTASLLERAFAKG